MTVLFKRHDEVVRIDQRPGEITFKVRRQDKSLANVTLMRPVWTQIKEIGFDVQEIVLSESDPAVIAKIRSRHPDAPLPGGLCQVCVKDREETKISVIFGNES